MGAGGWALPPSPSPLTLTTGSAVLRRPRPLWTAWAHVSAMSPDGWCPTVHSSTRQKQKHSGALLRASSTSSRVPRCVSALTIVVKKKFFYAFYSGHVFFTFLKFFILPTFFLIFKNVHWKYHLKSLPKQRKQIGSVWLFFFVPMLEFPYRPIYW